MGGLRSSHTVDHLLANLYRWWEWFGISPKNISKIDYETRQPELEHDVGSYHERNDLEAMSDRGLNPKEKLRTIGSN